MRRSQRLGFVLAAAIAMAVSACGAGDGGASDDVEMPLADTVATVDVEISETGGTPDIVPDIPLPLAPEGTRTWFELDADWSDGASFWHVPYPSDLRLAEEGTPDLVGFPNGAGLALIDDIGLTAGQRRGFPQVPVVYFQFDGPLASRAPEDVIAASVDAPVLLVDVDPRSPERGRLVPTVAKTLEPDSYAPEWLLAVAPRPGFELDPRTTYAAVVRRSLNDEGGAPLGVAPDLHVLANDRVPDGPRGAAAATLYAPLWETLDELGVPASQVAAATVFTTGDVVGDLYAQSEAVRAEYAPRITDLHVDPDDGAAHERFCELHGTIVLPQFQQGDPPFYRDGLFDEPTPDALPVWQRDEPVPVAVTLPNAPMPAEGYPLVLYFHGSGGYSTQVVDRGPILEPDGERTKGEGPAFVLAPHGIAMSGSALPVNPQRVPGADDLTYINPSNLKAYRDTMRQGVLEQRLILDALLVLEISGDVLAACPGVPAPADGAPVRFDPSRIGVMGQSQGAIYANMVAPLDPRVRALVPTGSGGLWSHQILISPRTQLAPLIALALRTDVPVTYLHPAMHLLETAWEPVETLVYMPRTGWDPLPEHPVRPVYQPAGKDDSFYPTELYDALALAFRHEQAGEERWPGMQEALALMGLDGLFDYPVHDNRTSRCGAAYTSVVVQYDGDGLADPHTIFSQLDEVKHQYGCFFETVFATGTGVVPAPAPRGTPCTQP